MTEQIVNNHNHTRVEALTLIVSSQLNLESIIQKPFASLSQEKPNYCWENFYDLIGALVCLFWYGFTYTETKVMEAYNNNHIWCLRGMLTWGVYLNHDEKKSLAKTAFEKNDLETLILLLRHHPDAKVGKMPLTFYALQSNKLDILKGLLDSRLVDINATHHGRTLLEAAYMNKNNDAVAELLSRGPDLRSLKGKKLELINELIRLGKQDIVKMLIEQDVDPDLTLLKGKRLNLLHELMRLGERDIAKILIEQNVDFDLPDNAKKTPLAFAFEQGDREIAHLLVKHGASYLPRDKEFPDLLLEACARGWFDVASDMLDNISEMVKNHPGLVRDACLNQQDGNGRTPLMRACLENQEDFALKLIQNGASIHIKDKIGRGVMHYACERGLNRVFDELVFQRGMHLTDADNNRSTPLEILFLKGDGEMLEKLIFRLQGNGNALQNGSFLFEAFRDRVTDLKPLLLKLIQAGIGLEVKNEQGYTLMHVAAAHGDQTIIDALLAQGVSVDVLNQDELTPMQYAVRNKNFLMAAHLYKKGANILRAVPEAQQFDEGTYKEFVVALGKEVPAGVFLSSVCARGDLTLVNKAIKRKADFRVRDENSLLPIHHAVIHGHLDVVQALCMSGISLNDELMKTGTGETALHLAVKSGQLPMVKYLVNEQGLLNEKDHQGNTALIIARQNNQQAIFKFLSEQQPAVSALDRMKQAISSLKK